MATKKRSTISTLSKPSGSSLTPWLGFAAIVILLDQLSKITIAKLFVYGESLSITSFFNLVLAYNKGAAFSFLAAESGWYDGDLEGRLGQLDSELFRARRLVVDTGIHAKHWTRQQAIDYGIEASEIERYVVNPGQACAYMLGELKIIELRDRAKSALGDRFSAKEFHNAVLATGTAPLDVLERQVNAYVASRSNR